MPYRRRRGRRPYRRRYRRRPNYATTRIGRRAFRTIAPKHYNVKVHQTLILFRTASGDAPSSAFTVTNQSGSTPDTELRSWKLSPPNALRNIFNTATSTTPGRIEMEDISNYGHIFAQIRCNGMAVKYVPLLGDDYRMHGTASGAGEDEYADPATLTCAIDYENGAQATNQNLDNIEQMNKVRRFQLNRRWSYFIRIFQKRGWASIDSDNITINDPDDSSSKWPAFHFSAFAQGNSANRTQYGRLLVTAYISLRYKDN